MQFLYISVVCDMIIFINNIFIQKRQKMQKTVKNDNMTIMKQNSLILAKWKEELDSIDIRIVNVLIHSLQNELTIDNQKLNLFNYVQVMKRKVYIRASTFKENGNFGINSNKEIFESLLKIRNTSTVLRNFTDLDGKKYKAKTVSLIDDVGILDKTNKDLVLDPRNEVFEITFNEWFLETSTAAFNTNVGNFTPLILNDLFSIKGKYGMKLYELLQQNKYRCTSFSMSLNDLRDYFHLPKSSLSVIVQRVLINNSDKVSQMIPFEYEVFKKDKIVSFSYLDLRDFSF